MLSRSEKKRRLVEALEASDWAVSKAARRLGVYRQALQRDLRPWGGVLALRKQVEKEREDRCAATDRKGVAGATSPSDKDPSVPRGATQITESERFTLTKGGDFPNVSSVESQAIQSAETPVRTATVPLSWDEWVWLRRRAEREAAAGGDSSVRGAVRACIREAMTRKDAEAKDE